MRTYIRNRTPGGIYFFTVNLAERQGNTLLADKIDCLRAAFRETFATYPNWEHLIRDEQDYVRHVDYIHYNPIKHGLVTRTKDWPYSTFSRWVDRGVYHENWGDNELCGMGGK
jgi:REP element-mobilizing transposase RayT